MVFLWCFLRQSSTDSHLFGAMIGIFSLYFMIGKGLLCYLYAKYWYLGAPSLKYNRQQWVIFYNELYAWLIIVVFLILFVKLVLLFLISLVILPLVLLILLCVILIPIVKSTTTSEVKVKEILIRSKSPHPN